MTATFFPRRLFALLIVAASALLTTTPAMAGGSHGPARPVSVLTYNIHHGVGVDGVLDLERIAQVIEDSSADVIGLQEVDNHWSSRSDKVDQAAWLAQRLHLHYAFAANLDLDPANPGEPRRQYGTAILSKYKLSDVRNTLLPLYPGQEQRGLLEATIKARGARLTIADTHLTSSNDAERQEQADRVVELLGHRHNPVTLVGDLNAEPADPEIVTLTDVFGDSWVEAGSGPGYTYEAALPTKRIDFVLHSRGVHARHIEVLSTLASDHLPVLADLAVAKY